MQKLMKVDLHIHSVPYLSDDDHCFYFLDYVEGGYQASPHNSMVLNFKKDLSFKNNVSWCYREQAVRNFALMLHGALSNVANRITIIPMPTSKPQNSLKFNDRLLATIGWLQVYGNNMYHIENCLDTKEESIPSHISGNRKPEDLFNNINFTFPKSRFKEYIILIDDVLTTGAHFKVCKDILTKYSSVNIGGIFLAKTDHRIIAFQ